ncbi:hypothetical protein QAD02_014497 [Eretmocerus hayati]|uniref:Uncharacterized protein n=1 Tax=Eretmocerus hayati TaxID=131215 RepID=A0ACC2P5P7_9HYME|nr:hypothetical protein QAD02_014497 [Eretmocerus hayati]
MPKSGRGRIGPSGGPTDPNIMRKLHRGHSQSRCFFLGPIISSVVALQTDLAKPWPARLCLAASSLSFIVCPAMATVAATLEDDDGGVGFDNVQGSTASAGHR